MRHEHSPFDKPMLHDVGEPVKSWQRFLGCTVTGVWSLSDQEAYNELYKLTDYGWDFSTLCTPDFWDFCFNVVSA